MPETAEKTAQEKQEALEKARDIYRQIRNYNPNLNAKAAHLVYDIGTLLNIATGKRENLRFLDPEWKDSDDDKANHDKEMDCYFKVNFTANYCDKINMLKKQIGEVMDREADVKAGLGDKISELRRTLTKAAEPHGLIKLEVKDPGYEVNPEQKKRLFAEADYFNSEMERLSAMPKLSQAEMGQKSEYWMKIKNLKEVLGDEMPQHKAPQIAGEEKASSINIGAMVTEASTIQKPVQIPQAEGVLQK